MSHRGPSGSEQRRQFTVYDCRTEESSVTSRLLKTSGVDFYHFLRLVHQEFKIQSCGIFVLVTTDRTVLDNDKFEVLQDGSTIYILQNQQQALPVAMEERIQFTPHYDTLIRSGLHEYYASQGQIPLPYTFAELIDNALSATAKNTGPRKIELIMILNESLGKPAIIVLDNGCGMTSKQLNNWAVYRLSKFTRENSRVESEQPGYVPPDPVRRSVNSDISYFGVGGKQAVFYIGDSARMISKPFGSPDVHELLISKEDFERKAKNKEDVYSGVIRNRKPGDYSHVNKPDERNLRNLIIQESKMESFTAIVITGIQPMHVTYLKENFEELLRSLAHTYHYYIHGVDGNDSSLRNSGHAPQIEILVTLHDNPPRPTLVRKLRDVATDMQTLYINTAADTFEFKATTGKDNGTVEGVIRYHPFLYDRETYPEDRHTMQAPHDDEECDEFGVQPKARGRRPIFECFWNGRLIPYTSVHDFDWCAWPTKGAKLPEECYSRFSGVLFTNDRFQVSTNKLTFMELEQKMKDRDTIFTRIVNGQGRRNIQKEFTQWLKSCHEKFDKQVKFLGFKGIITRTDVSTKKMQHPWSTFSSVEWDGKTYKAGQLVKSQKTQPILHGKVVQFLLYGQHGKDVFATGGQVEVSLEPVALHNKSKILPISKIDRAASVETIRTNIEKDINKLPHVLNVDWPEGNPWPQNAVRPAGTPLGALNVKILDTNEGSLSKMPTSVAVIKLSVKLEVVRHGPENKNEEVVSFVAQHSPKWGFGFKKIEKLTVPGEYTLSLKAMINENHATVFGGRDLPSYKLNFKITAGIPETFDLVAINSIIYVGIPFNIRLLLKDSYGNLTKPLTGPPSLPGLPELKCSGLDLSHETVDSRGTTFIIQGVKAKGKLLNYQPSKTYNLIVTLPGIKKATEAMKICLLPGSPHSLHVKTDGNTITVENGNPARFNVEIHDLAGNVTARPNQIVCCKVDGSTLAKTDCSATGAGQLETKPLNQKLIGGQPQKLNVTFEMPSHKSVASVMRELEVIPSTRVSQIELYCGYDENLVLKKDEKIQWLAGGSLENLFYKLYDEAGRVVPLTTEITSMIKVNWTTDSDLQDLAKGKLPDVQVPKQVQEVRFYQVSYQDQSVSISFSIVPHPDKPAKLNANLRHNSVKLGETLSGNINLELVDQYDNATETLTSDCVNQMRLDAVGLDTSAVTFNWQESSKSVQVTGICFQSGTPDFREMRFSYLDYVTVLMVKVTAGDPAKLTLVHGPEQVVNGHSIATAFLVQVFDKWGNPSPDNRVVVEMASSPPALKVTAAAMTQPLDSEGKASFFVEGVSGPKGYYQLEFRGSFDHTPFSDLAVTLIVLPDPNKAVSLSVEYDTAAKFPAGATFPVFAVTVVSDEDRAMTTFNPAHVSMLLWEGVASGQRPPQAATQLRCNKPMEYERKGCFYFRNKEIPKRAREHTIQFSLRVNDTEVLYSNQITIQVEASEPVKLGPVSQPPAPVVSCGSDIDNRMLVKDLTLRITDSYGNPAGQSLKGWVVAFITHACGESNKSLPQFEGRQSNFKIPLEDGAIHIQRLTIMENSPGEDGSEYNLLFKADVSLTLEPFQLPFRFYNDAVSQKKMCELLKKEKELKAAVVKHNEIQNDCSQLLTMLTKKCISANGKVAALRDVLTSKNMAIAETATLPDVDKLQTEKTNEADAILKMPRRVCSIQDNFKGQQDVLGMVGHLAYVQDDAAARVVSWAIRGDMDCVITRTTVAARKIYDNTRGRQQVMALDSVYVSPYNRGLPHIRNGQMIFYPPGNPVFTRELLIFPDHKESCEIVFKNLLGDTILIDDLNSANIYRRAVVQNKIPCPTILTREGERISSNGKFGGAQNKAPPIQTLKVFGAPLPQQYHVLKEQTDLLSQYREAMEKKKEAEKEHADHLKNMSSPDMKKKERDMKENEMRLKEIEREIRSTPVRPVKRSLEYSAHTLHKRAK